MNHDSPDPIEEWRDVSARAARAGGFRDARRPDGRTRGAGGWPLGLVAFAVVALVVGLSFRQGGADASPSPAASVSRDALHLRADALLAAWAAASSGTRVPAFVGDLTGQTGDWEEAVGDNNKRALMAGLLKAASPLSTDVPPDAELRWSDGSSVAVPVRSAAQAFDDVTTAGAAGACDGCKALEVTGASLTTVPVETTRGPATAPAWRFTIAGTSVTVTRVAVAEAPAPASPPPFLQALFPTVRRAESASGSAAEPDLVLDFVGAPGPASEPCGADYTAEAVESPLAVVVIVTEHANPTPANCRLVGASRTAAMVLGAPLGDRAVIDIVEGLPLPLARPSSEPSGPSEPTVGPTIGPSPTLSADALVAREFVRKYEDGLTTGHADVSWRFLSPWSRTTVGSFSTFSDGARRTAAASPGLPMIEDPSRSPDLLDPSFLGLRAADIAAVGDPDRTFVVAVRWPDVDGAAAATENLVVAPIDGDWRIWLDTAPGSFGMLAFPQGCAAYELSDRRCEAVVAAAAAQATVDRATSTAIWLLPDPGCGGDPLTSDILLCTRTMSFVAGVRFDLADGRRVRQDIFCGVGPPSLVCSETPGIRAIDFHGAGYWDVPCAGEAPAGCPSPIPSPVGAGGAELRITALDVPVGAVGHREVEIGTAVLLDGIVQEARFSITDQVQTGFLLATGTVRLELRSTIAGRPPFDNAYMRGIFDGPEQVRVVLIFDVAETSPDAVIHVADVLVR